MKALIVIDIDETHLHKESMELYKRLKGYKCLLKPMPQKNEIKNEEEFMNVCGWMFEVQTGMDIGWNDCIDEIMGETE